MSPIRRCESGPSQAEKELVVPIEEAGGSMMLFDCRAATSPTPCLLPASGQIDRHMELKRCHLEQNLAPSRLFSRGLMS
jgi:hypothetical protein